MLEGKDLHLRGSFRRLPASRSDAIKKRMDGTVVDRRTGVLIGRGQVNPLPPYNLAGAAARLHKSERWLRGFLSGRSTDAEGRPLYRLAGRTKLFDDVHIQRLFEALPCPSSFKPPAKAKARTGRSAEPTAESEWTRAARLLNDPSLLTTSKSSKARSSEANTRPRPRLTVVA
jgi:hypothetical protein